MLKEGDMAPDIDLESDGGGQFWLSEMKGRPVVVYFYPRDDTSGCTREAIDFSTRAADFAGLGAHVVGISPDTAASHDKFKKKHKLNVQLAADTEKTVAQAYGVWIMKNMYGRKFMGVERATFLIDAEGKIVRIWRKVRVPGHVDDVLEEVRSLVA